MAARAIGLAVFLLALALILGPFAIMGVWWFMYWPYVAAPLSLVVNKTMGIGSTDHALILAVSLATAAGWGLLAYLIARLAHRAKPPGSSGPGRNMPPASA